MTRSSVKERMFKRAVLFSAFLHTALFIFIILSPSFSKPDKKGTIFYVPLGALGGGGSGGPGAGGGAKAAKIAPQKKEMLKDLTVASKIKPEARPSMTYPTDKPKKRGKPIDEKKASISRDVPETEGTDLKTGTGTGTGDGSGTGLRIGLGEGPGGGGSGIGYGDGSGVAGFPFQYYLQIVSDRVSASWFTSLVDPGVSGTFSATVYFKIQRDGRIADVFVKQSSGIPSLDLSAQRAIQTSSPFPPLPREYEGGYLGIHLIFEHSK